MVDIGLTYLRIRGNGGGIGPLSLGSDGPGVRSAAWIIEQLRRGNFHEKRMGNKKAKRRQKKERRED